MKVNHNTAWVERGRIDDSFLKKRGVTVGDLMFYVTQQCNLRCKHCYVGNQWLDSEESFSREEAQLILQHFGAHGLSRLTFLGGEPVLYPYITDLILQTRDYKIREKRMTTNAVTLGFLDLGRVNCTDVDHISVSVDGITAETHERIRGRGTFAKTLTNIQTLLSHGFDVRVTFTVSGINKHEVHDSVRFFRSLGISEVNYHLVSMIGNARVNEDLHIDPREWLCIRRCLEGMDDAIGIRLRIPYMFVTPQEYADLIREGKYHPFQRRSYHSETGQRLVLYPNGKVYMSCDLTGTDFNFARFENGRFLPTDGVDELNVWEEQPQSPDPSASLLGVDGAGLVRLSISYKRTVGV